MCMKSLGWKPFWVFALEQSLDGQTDLETDEVITIGLPGRIPILEVWILLVT